tara:strand:+ start:131 stop:544 length:414 start_codon:yes stop_codon:yes gene_type:complete
MTVEIILSYPPIIDDIVKVFPAVKQTKGVIFSWGDRIYNPDDIIITPSLHAHELVHGQRQTADESAIVKWWQTYLADMEFRLNEEILGHKAELAHQLKTIKDRNQRNMLLHQIAARLSGPVYGNIISLTEAKRRLNP